MIHWFKSWVNLAPTEEWMVTREPGRYICDHIQKIGEIQSSESMAIDPNAHLQLICTADNWNDC